MQLWYGLAGSRLARYWTQFTPNARWFLLSTVISGITLSGFQLFFNIFLKSRGYPLDFIGLLNAIPSGAALVVGVPMGLLSDRMGRKPAMLTGLSLATAAYLVLVNTQIQWLMVVMAGVQGVANSLYFLSMAPFMMSASREKERTLLFSLNFGLQTLAGVVGSLLAGQLPAWFGARLGVGAEHPLAYQAVLTASVLGGGLALLPILLIREARWPGPQRTARLGRAELRRLLRPEVLRLAMPNFIIGIGAAILIPYFSLYYKSRYHLDDRALGLLFSLSALTTGVATVIGPDLARRLGGKIRAVVVTQAASVLMLLIMGFTPVFWISGLAALLRGALMNLSNPLYSAFTMEQTPAADRGAVNSVMQLMWEVGWAFGPYVSGMVQDRWGFPPLFITTAGLYALAIGFTWTTFRHTETPPAAADPSAPGA